MFKKRLPIIISLCAVMFYSTSASAEVIPTSNTLNVCVKPNGQVYLLAPDAACKDTETKLKLQLQGPQGELGATGPKGDKGDIGAQGIQGDTGMIGPVGPPGLKGDTGAAGPTGSQGPKGDTGEAGATGPQGLKGDTGEAGPTGAPGPKGDIGVTGPAGPAGPQGIAGVAGVNGPMGPMGLPGQLAIYGDGTAGAFSVPVGSTLDLTTLSGFNSLAGKDHFQFTSINIAGNLIIPSGVVLRATGDVTITGTITVATAAQDSGNGAPHPGLSLAAPGTTFASPNANSSGGIGLSALTASHILTPPTSAGGAGDRNYQTTGGEGGGSLSIMAKGNIRVNVGGAINANGMNATNPGGASDISGGGGGGGGVIILVAKGSMTIGGTLRTNGGNGAIGVNGNAGTSGSGGGGGGGGGIIHLISSSSPAVTGTIQVNGGAAGTDANTGATNYPGGGGGASGGNGGKGGAYDTSSAAFVAAQAGGAGYTFTTVVPEPENIIIR
ncbi:collagen-like protein [Paenibacillus sp. HWE-109]|uniref:collagen-like protein n=1 Tax=Paenibacillus sp. HWE-109 TaxID=1306526 RepID=UPI001EDDCC86|nr:collagen-like protein [Paenibacillus sp. HWE-109]UKS26312.1 collagen-like protein [Paenibacillus sp. HWE-109]